MAGGGSASDNSRGEGKAGRTGAASTAVNFAITGTNDNPTVTAGAQSVQLVEAGVGTAGTASASITLIGREPGRGRGAVSGGAGSLKKKKATGNGWGNYTNNRTYGHPTLTTANGV